LPPACARTSHAQPAARADAACAPVAGSPSDPGMAALRSCWRSLKAFCPFPASASMHQSRLAVAEVLHYLPYRSIHPGSFEPGRHGLSQPYRIKPYSDRGVCE
jgi:hypothetical protein